MIVVIFVNLIFYSLLFNTLKLIISLLLFDIKFKKLVTLYYYIDIGFKNYEIDKVINILFVKKLVNLIIFFYLKYKFNQNFGKNIISN